MTRPDKQSRTIRRQGVEKTPPASAIPGSATVIGTRKFADRFRDGYSPDFFRKTASGLTVSSLGMGTYLGDCDDREDDRYTAVIESGIAAGLNVVDTAINYRCQRSERAVGRAIRRVIATGVARRESVVICTKGGYVPLDGVAPASRDDYDRYLTSNYFDRSIMSPGDLVAGGHCVHPRFLADQITRSRSNLGLERIDVFYLHNPEQQLDVLDRTAFRAAMRAAFSELEAQVSAGTISFFGCATWNGFRVFAAKRNHLSLRELVDIAEEVAGKSHHFRFVQLPVNLAMTEAVRLPTQTVAGKNLSLLDCAGDAEISVVASASLMQSQLTRQLPDAVRAAFPALRTDAQRALAFVRSLPVATSLAGMRSTEHLDENIESAKAVSPA